MDQGNEKPAESLFGNAKIGGSLFGNNSTTPLFGVPKAAAGSLFGSGFKIN